MGSEIPKSEREVISDEITRELNALSERMRKVSLRLANPADGKTHFLADPTLSVGELKINLINLKIRNNHFSEFEDTTQEYTGSNTSRFEKKDE